MFEFKNVQYAEGWDSPDFVGVAMTFTITETKTDNSKHPFIVEICTASDSGQPRKMCWCPECAEIRKEYGVRKQREKKAYRY